MAELSVSTDTSDDLADYERTVITQIGRHLQGKIASAVLFLLNGPADSVRIALAVTISRDEDGVQIVPELSVRSTETDEKRSLTPYRIGQLTLFDTEQAG